MAAAQPIAPNALRVAAVWGTTVVAMKTLERGTSFVLGDDLDAALPIPDGIEMSAMPLRAAAGGWELDARGSIGGLLTLRGRAEDPVAIARVGQPVPVMPGDYGLIQYGQFSDFHLYRGDALPENIYAGEVPWKQLKGAVPLELVNKIRAGFLLHGVDIAAWPGGFASAAHTSDDVTRTVAAFEATFDMLAAEGAL